METNIFELYGWELGLDDDSVTDSAFWQGGAVKESRPNDLPPYGMAVDLPEGEAALSVDGTSSDSLSDDSLRGFLGVPPNIVRGDVY